MSLTWEKQEMSITVSERRATVQWRIKDFPRIKAKVGDEIESGTFQFLSATWNISMFPNGELRHDAGNVILYLNRTQSSIPEQNVKFKFSYKDKLGRDSHSIEQTQTYEENVGSGTESCIRRKDVLTGHLRELLLKNDVLTVCCEIRENVADEEEEDAKEEEDAMEGIEVTSKCCNSEHKKLVLDLDSVFENSEFTDVMIKVEGAEYPAHKAILESRSSVFQAMFQSDMMEDWERVVDIQEMKAQAAKEMLRYIYTGKVEDLSRLSAVDLYEAGARYNLQGLKETCQRFLCNNIGVDNMCHVAVIADLYSDNQLKTVVEHFLHRNLEVVLASDTWKKFADEKSAFFLDLMSSVVLKYGRGN